MLTRSLDTDKNSSPRLNLREVTGPTPWTRRDTYFVVAICFLGLILRAGYLLISRRLIAPATYDGISYDLLARHLVQGTGFHLGPSPTTFRPPGYPFFLGALYTVFGPELAVARAAQVILGTITPFLMYVLVVRLHLGARVARITALGLSVHPLLIYMTGTIYPELLSIVLLLGALIALGIAPDQLTRRRAILAGAIFGMLILVRPASLVMLGLLTIWLLLARVYHGQSLILVAVFLLATAAIVLPWTIRNYLVSGDFVLVSTNGGVNFWGGNNPLATGGLVEASPATWQGRNPPIGLEGWPNLSEKQSDDRFTRTALHWIEAHPAAFLRLLPRKFERAWWLDFGNEGRSLSLPRPVSILYGVFLIVAFAGLLESLRRWRQFATAYLVVGETTVTSLLFFGSTRQSALVAPFVILLAAVAVVHLVDLKKPHFL